MSVATWLCIMAAWWFLIQAGWDRNLIMPIVRSSAVVVSGFALDYRPLVWVGMAFYYGWMFVYFRRLFNKQVTRVVR